MEAISLEMKPVVYPRATWDTFQSKLKKQKKLKKKSSLKILFLSFQKQVFLIYQELKLSSSKICYVFQKKNSYISGGNFQSLRNKRNSISKKFPSQSWMTADEAVKQKKSLIL